MNKQVWIPISERLPNDRQDVIVGHELGKWVLTGVRYIDGVFRMLENTNIGGDAGYKQYKQEVAVHKRLWSGSCNPTHWMEIPIAP